jgi:MFS family permease
LGNSLQSKLSNLKAVEPLKNAAFRMFFSSRICDSIAANMRQLSLALLLYRLTGSAALLGILVLARAIPLILVTPLAGALADKLPKKTIIQVSGALNVMVALFVAFSLTTGWLSAEHAGSYWILIAVSFTDGVLTSFRGPASDAMIVEVVGPQMITSAVAVNQIGQNAFRLIAPAIAGFMIDSLGFEFVYYTMAVFYLSSVVLMFWVPRAIRKIDTRVDLFRDTRDVSNYILKERNIM